MDEAAINYATVGNELVRPGLEDEGRGGDAVRMEVGDAILSSKIREFSKLGLVLGSNYHRSLLLVPDGTVPPLKNFMHYVPSASPGCLAPHLWLSDRSSLCDGFGLGFTLLVTQSDRDDAQPMMAVASLLDMPLTVLAPDDERLPRLYRARFALIRPDQHVVWRSDTLPTDPAAMLAHVAGNLNHVGGSSGCGNPIALDAAGDGRDDRVGGRAADPICWGHAHGLTGWLRRRRWRDRTGHRGRPQAPEPASVGMAFNAEFLADRHNFGDEGLHQGRRQLLAA